MAFTASEKSYLNNLKSTLTEDQWSAFLELTKTQQKNQLVAAIDADVTSLNAAISALDAELTARENEFNSKITQLNALKTKVQAL